MCIALVIQSDLSGSFTCVRQSTLYSFSNDSLIISRRLFSLPEAGAFTNTLSRQFFTSFLWTFFVILKNYLWTLNSGWCIREMDWHWIVWSFRSFGREGDREKCTLLYACRIIVSEFNWIAFWSRYDWNRLPHSCGLRWWLINFFRCS